MVVLVPPRIAPTDLDTSADAGALKVYYFVQAQMSLQHSSAVVHIELLGKHILAVEHIALAVA